jgi:hypothetical protein
MYIDGVSIGAIGQTDGDHSEITVSGMAGRCRSPVTAVLTAADTGARTGGTVIRRDLRLGTTVSFM